jgi:hypothetical protein
VIVGIVAEVMLDVGWLCGLATLGTILLSCFSRHAAPQLSMEEAALWLTVQIDKHTNLEIPLVPYRRHPRSPLTTPADNLYVPVTREKERTNSCLFPIHPWSNKRKQNYFQEPTFEHQNGQRYVHTSLDTRAQVHPK